MHCKLLAFLYHQIYSEINKPITQIHLHSVKYESSRPGPPAPLAPGGPPGAPCIEPGPPGTGMFDRGGYCCCVAIFCFV